MYKYTVYDKINKSVYFISIFKQNQFNRTFIILHMIYICYMIYNRKVYYRNFTVNIEHRKTRKMREPSEKTQCKQD